MFIMYDRNIQHIYYVSAYLMLDITNDSLNKLKLYTLC